MGTEKEMSNTFADICKTWNQLIEEEKILERKEILDYLEDTELFSRSDLRNADNMLNNNQSVPINELAERFIKIDKEFSGRPWNILQILSQINMIVPVEDRKCVETGAEEFQKDKLPNLELLQYKAESVLRELNQLAEFPEYDIDCFSQIWGSTCTGFDKTKEGMPLAGGSAMTKEYTTIVHELTNDIYLVFFGDRLCYKVEKATKEFLKDLKDRNLKPLSEALVKY